MLADSPLLSLAHFPLRLRRRPAPTLRLLRLPRLRVVAVDVSEVAAGLDGVADAALQLLSLGEPAIDLAVPEDAPLRPCGAIVVSFCLRLSGDFGRRRDEDQLDYERAPRRGLQGHLP